MSYQILLEKNDRIEKLRYGLTIEEAKKGILDYINSSDDMDFEIWVEVENEDR